MRFTPGQRSVIETLEHKEAYSADAKTSVSFADWTSAMSLARRGVVNFDGDDKFWIRQEGEPQTGDVSAQDLLVILNKVLDNGHNHFVVRIRYHNWKLDVLPAIRSALRRLGLKWSNILSSGMGLVAHPYNTFSDRNKVFLVETNDD